MAEDEVVRLGLGLLKVDAGRRLLDSLGLALFLWPQATQDHPRPP